MAQTWCLIDFRDDGGTTLQTMPIKSITVQRCIASPSAIPRGAVGKYCHQNKGDDQPDHNNHICKPIITKRGNRAAFWDLIGTIGYTARSTIIFLTSAIALAGFNPLGQVFAQFMIV